jgi:hypothetical protein
MVRAYEYETQYKVLYLQDQIWRIFIIFIFACAAKSCCVHTTAFKPMLLLVVLSASVCRVVWGVCTKSERKTQWNEQHTHTTVDIYKHLNICAQFFLKGWVWWQRTLSVHALLCQHNLTKKVWYILLHAARPCFIRFMCVLLCLCMYRAMWECMWCALLCVYHSRF